MNPAPPMTQHFTGLLCKAFSSPRQTACRAQDHGDLLSATFKLGHIVSDLAWRYSAAEQAEHHGT
jgi:hypothetical protein